MDENKFDVMLDMADENFTEDLMKALGVEKGEKINFITPQFERTDGRTVSYLPKTPEEYEAIKLMEPDNLKKVGCQIWEEENGVTHWLYPSEWYDSIPNGTEIISICGNAEKFEHGKTDNDIRFGALAYGFKQTQH